jgi:hypothetical protein
MTKGLRASPFYFFGSDPDSGVAVRLRGGSESEAHVWRRTISVPVFGDRVFAISRADVRLERDPVLTLESVEPT